MNRVKFREWWRPTAPVLTLASVPRVFARAGANTVSPFMSFAPPLREEMRTLAPAVVHYDGTARPQTVTPADEPWVHALLVAVGRRVASKLPMLINTSFNTKGRPIINSAAEALRMLCALPDLDVVVIDEWLFEKAKVKCELLLSTAVDV